MWDEITYAFPNFDNWVIIGPHKSNFDAMELLSQTWINFNLGMDK